MFTFSMLHGHTKLGPRAYVPSASFVGASLLASKSPGTRSYLHTSRVPPIGFAILRQNSFSSENDHPFHVLVWPVWGRDNETWSF
jgi:hypothetical protein